MTVVSIENKREHLKILDLKEFDNMIAIIDYSANHFQRNRAFQALVIGESGVLRIIFVL